MQQKGGDRKAQRKLKRVGREEWKGGRADAVDVAIPLA